MNRRVVSHRTEPDESVERLFPCFHLVIGPHQSAQSHVIGHHTGRWPHNSTMKLTSLVILVTAPLIGAFSSSFTPGSTSLLSQSPASRHALSMEYIPSGMSKEQWRKVKEQEKNKMQGKNLGKVGITTFKSRSFADWQASGGKNLVRWQ